MPLIDLKTSLKSLKYGKDRPYEGSSNQPYIQSSIPEGDIPSSGGPDFILRGGILAPVRAAKDVSRLTQMFFDLKSPNGSLFIAKQNILSRTSVQTQASSNGGVSYAGGAINQGVYLPSSTLAQAGVGFTGTHLNLLGIDPSSPMTGVTSKGISDLFSNTITLGLKRYEDVVYENPDEYDLSKNRLYKLSTSNGFITQPNQGPKEPQSFFQKIGNYLNNYSTDSPGEGILMEYSGGPGSILGIGQTTIQFADRRTGTSISRLKNDGFFTNGYSIFKRKTTVEVSNSTPNINGSSINYINTVPSGSIKGASSTYASILGGQEVDNAILYDVNQRNNTFTFNVYKSGSLIPDPLATKYNSTFIPPKINFTGSVPSGSIKGASSTYEFVPGGQPVNNNIDYRLNSRGNTYNFSVYNTGSLTPDLEFAINYKKLTTKSPKINFTGSVPSGSIKGASSTYESFTGGSQIDNGINYTQNTINFNSSVYKSGSFAPTTRLTDNGSLTLTQTQLIGQPRKGEIQDFRKVLISGSRNGGNTGTAADNIKNENSSITSLAPNYQTKNIENRLDLGNPGKSNKNVFSYTAASSNNPTTNYKLALDKITAGAIYSSSSADHIKNNGKYAGNDLVKFSIGVIQNDTTGNSNYMHFRAFIDSFSDSYTSDWNSYNYIGRGDKFYNYTGFERTVNLSFTVFAQSKAELIPMYKKLNYLASSLAPDYSEVGGFMKGNLHKMTIGGYLFEQVGIIKSLTYDIPEETPWEIGINDVGGFDDTVKELPHMIKVTNLSFVPIQDFLPRVANPQNQKNTRYIALSKNVGNDYSNYE
jgi:hypothetical protein